MTAKLYTAAELSIDAYHAFSDIKKLGNNAVLSKSMLSVFDECAKKFHDEYILGNRDVGTKEMRLGNAVHVFALQPELFNANYYLLPLKPDRKQMTRNKDHACYQEQLALAKGRIDIQPSEMEKVKGMAESLKNDKRAMILLDKPGKIEASIFWTDKETGLKFRCRPDFMPDDGILVDLKTTGRADDHSFHKVATDMYYDVSVALTARGYKELTGEYPREYAFLIVEADRPYVVEGKLTNIECNYQGGKICKSFYQIGDERLSRILERYLKCKERNIWPGYNEIFMPMLAQDYMVRKLYTGE